MAANSACYHALFFTFRMPPQWDQPVPDDWQAGGGWGQQPIVLMAGLE